MRRETANVLLILLGGALLKLAYTGDYLRYVKPVHQPWVIGGGTVMLLLGALAIWRDVRSGSSGQEGARHGHSHGHSHGGTSAWLLLVPVFAVLFVAPPALGADSVARSAGGAARVQANAAETAAFSPLPAGRAVPMPLTEFQARAGWDEDGTLEDRTVALTGFIAHRGDESYVARMVIGCCAADGYPVTVRLGGAGAEQASRLSDDEWVTVTGGLVPGSATEATEFVPELAVETVRVIDPPSDPYEY